MHNDPQRLPYHPLLQYHHELQYPQLLPYHPELQYHQLHPDHRAAGQAALDALYAAREWYIFPEQLVEGIDPWRVREVYLFWTDHADHWEDISDVIETRLAALSRHASQVGLNFDKLAERIRERARTAGESDGFAAAEEFKRLVL